MKKKIAILGSTGSIGQNLLKIVNRDKKQYEIVLLTANKNYLQLLKQAKKFKVKNIIIKDNESFKKIKKKNNIKYINIYNDFESYKKIFRKKINYVMSSISGTEGLIPTIKIIKHTKKIAIANKESIICAWNLIDRELKKYKTSFVPVDSEHYSLWYALGNTPNSKVEKIYLTASGGPLLNIKKLNLKNIKLFQALKHPNWRMGKKISIDSCTMMNKVFEVVEAKHIFNLPYKKISILTHPSSYVHAIVKFKNGLIKIIAHDTTMTIPIYNTINLNENTFIKTENLNLEKLNNLRLKKVNFKLFPLVKILKKLPQNISLFETVLVSINDYLVSLYLDKKISYNQLQVLLMQFINNKVFAKYKKLKPNKIQDIISVKNKVNSFIIKSINK
tara:strand:+ start:947 stop:2113 length:1167 start_codon:yes stop_codon:yes gene_type:complete